MQMYILINYSLLLGDITFLYIIKVSFPQLYLV